MDGNARQQHFSYSYYGYNFDECPSDNANANNGHPSRDAHGNGNNGRPFRNAPRNNWANRNTNYGGQPRDNGRRPYADGTRDGNNHSPSLLDCSHGFENQENYQDMSACERLW